MRRNRHPTEADTVMITHNDEEEDGDVDDDDDDDGYDKDEEEQTLNRSRHCNDHTQ